MYLNSGSLRHSNKGRQNKFLNKIIEANKTPKHLGDCNEFTTTINKQT